MLSVVEGFRFSHNGLRSLSAAALGPALRPFMLCRSRLDALLLLDLSHNLLTTLDDPLFAELPSLQILQLHANQIASFKQLQCLTR